MDTDHHHFHTLSSPSFIIYEESHHLFQPVLVLLLRMLCLQHNNAVKSIYMYCPLLRGWQLILLTCQKIKKSLETISLFVVEAMMDRERKDELPQMQVEFIDSVCVPLYSILSERLLTLSVNSLSKHLSPCDHFAEYS
jgi:hypothetical protein